MLAQKHICINHKLKESVCAPLNVTSYKLWSSDLLLIIKKLKPFKKKNYISNQTLFVNNIC